MILRMYFFILYMGLCSCEWKYEMKDSVKFKLRYTIVSTIITHEKNWLIRDLEKGVYFDIQFKSNLCYNIYIRQKSPAVITRRTEFYIYENDTTNYSNKSEFAYELVEGFVTKEKYSSYVLGYVEDIYFYGKIQIADTIYYIEKLANYPELLNKHRSKKNAISFKRTFSTDTETTSSEVNYRPEFNLNNSKLFKRMAQRGNMCSLLILIDNSFITRVHGGNIKAAIKQVLLSIDEANSLFRSTDFDEDGYPDNIGFTIKYFILLKSVTNNRWIPKYTKRPIDGRYYMNRFSRFYLLEDVCLGVAFTGQSFHYDIVGISYAAVGPNPIFNSFGGICDRPSLNPYGLPLNTLAVSAKSTDGKIVPQYIFELSLCHEFGHSFGSDHDKGECTGYLMTAHAPLDQGRKHFIFSKCSKRMILTTIISRGYCFEADDSPYCGNGLIETNEECDCGTIRDCIAFDTCCVPHGRHNSCKIKRELGYQCHPSQGICCTSTCFYNKDLLKHDLDCTNFQKSCPCSNNSANCKCGVQGKFINNICASEECTRIEAEECVCPNDSKLGCMTCCQSITHSIPCIPANKLTKMAIDIDENLVNQLKLVKKDKRLNSFGFYEKFCAKENCVKVYFRRVKSKGYCLLFGQVGMCSVDHKCLLPKPKPFRLQQFSDKKSNNGGSIITINLFILKLLAIYHILC